MLDDSIKAQLQEHFAKLEQNITLRVWDCSHKQNYYDLLSLLEGVATTSNLIEVKKLDTQSENIQFDILSDGQETGIVFRLIPGGHEFSTLILAILNADGKGKMPDESLAKRIKNLKGPIELTTYVSLSCEVCPDVVQTLNQITLLNEHMKHTIVDGALFVEEIKKLGIQGVPAVYHQGTLFHSGKASLGELLDKIEKKFGKDESIQESSDLYDVAIVGGGPAGASAAIYSARKGLKVVLLAGKMGGQVEETKGIENLISLDYIEGKDLAADLEKRIRGHDVTILEHRFVDKIEHSDPNTLILTSGEKITAKSVIIATGAKWRELGIPGEKEYMGRGVAFCPHCDGPYFKGKDVAVIGGGNSGIEAAIDLAGIVHSVTVIEFMESLKADKVLVDRLNSLKNVEVITHAQMSEIEGDGDKVHRIVYIDRETEEKHSKNLDGVFVQIGLSPNSDFVKGTLETNKYGEIIIDEKCRTSLPSIYAAGDVTTTPFKQIIISMGEGAKAALTSFEDSIHKKVS